MNKLVRTVFVALVVPAAFCMICSLWGSSQRLVRVTLEAYHPITACGMRFSVATFIAIVLFGIFWVYLSSPKERVELRSAKSRQAIKYACFAGLISGAGMLGLYEASVHLSSIITTPLLALDAILVATIILIRKRSKLAALVFVLDLVALAGLCQLCWTLYHGQDALYQLWSCLLMGAAAVCFGASSFPLKKAEALPLLVQGVYFLLPQAGLVFVLTIVELLTIGAKPLHASAESNWEVWTATIWLGGAVTVGANYLYCFVLKQWGLILASTTTFIIPIVGIAVGIKWQDQPTQLVESSGYSLAMMLVPVILIWCINFVDIKAEAHKLKSLKPVGSIADPGSPVRHQLT